ncbi:MAG: 4-(cytidine 5'-diphospho)-2-C-methyl-D-erythritol kinase, partial [Limisphaerales bacterium]
NFPEALNGKKGRAEKLISRLRKRDLAEAAQEFYNSLESPVQKKFPLLILFQEFFRDNEVPTLMSGSGSTTFGLAHGKIAAENLLEKFKTKFGANFWTAIIPLAQ